MENTTKAGTGPPPVCYWAQEPGGTRWLVPGCIARLHDADTDTCPTLAQQLARTRADGKRLQRADPDGDRRRLLCQVQRAELN